MTNPDPARVREITTNLIMARINDYEYMSIGEAMSAEDDLKNLPDADRDAFQLAVDAAYSEAQIRITFPEVPAEGGRKLKGWLG